MHEEAMKKHINRALMALTIPAAMALSACGGAAAAQAAPAPAPTTASPSVSATPTSTSKPTPVAIDESSDEYAYGWFEAHQTDREADPSGSADYQAGYEAEADALAAWEAEGHEAVLIRAEKDAVLKDWYRAARKIGWNDGLYTREEIAEDVCRAWVLGQPGGKDQKLAEITAERYVDGAKRIDLAAADLVDTLVGQEICEETSR
jgi:hypothetical protein